MRVSRDAVSSLNPGKYKCMTLKVLRNNVSCMALFHGPVQRLSSAEDVTTQQKACEGERKMNLCAKSAHSHISHLS